MKKWFFLFLALPIFFGACKKASNKACTYTESALVAPAAEIAYLDSALAADGIAAMQHSSGVFYTIDSIGTGVNPGVCSIMTTTYIGNLYDYAIPFDSYTDSAGTSLTLGSLIVGWQKVLPLINAGGKVTLYIPPSLGYGEVAKRNGDGDIIIPAHSYLKFRISLLGVF